ncbi:WD40 repeat domain-containing protein [Actinoalloteichus fjordicus]|uniref:WD40 repeat domain-containing protein n=1 Tax=Actinoalloteichus TaxID=65496 RepID=UPI00384B2D1C
MAFSPDGQTLATAGDGTVRLWEIAHLTPPFWLADLRPRGGQDRAQAPGRGSDPLIRSRSSSRYSRTS